MEKHKKNIGFSLLRVTTEQFAIIEEGFDEKGQIRINTTFRFGTDKQQRFLGVFAIFTFESNKKPFLIIEASCQFKIEELAWEAMYKVDTNSLQVDKGFLSHLAMLTVGTARGILHAKTEGTCFNKFVLPTINVSDIIKADATFSFNAIK